MWDQTAEQARMRRNSHVSAWLSLAITVVAIGGVVALLSVSNIVGLYLPPTIARLGIGTFDGINVVFFFMWTSMLQLLSVNDGLQYRLKLGKKRVPRNGASDVLILQHGVIEVMTTYFILLVLVLVLIVIARRFNPVEFDEYDRHVRAILHLPTVERAAQ